MTQSNQCINWQVIDSLAEDDETRQMILTTFVESFQSDLNKLNEIRSENNLEQLIFIAHTIKGASSNFCHESTLNELKDIESQIKSKAHEDHSMLIQRLEKVTTLIIDELRSALK
ncbi:MAG: hypothetical protein COW01_10180 [Bdellovibrionales bacterium CG12_big_fil_rev_8_21_14_0_65_38_15]|nr:MAG: hypothetical protein COW79_07025 [Bdellovibrionales bacterium CG22_combo_CG10-13_8_21_14_all_38_13]PIQ54503.1 MAG: hypothetical protein COW01_10180 [Bdellovibrionales bacterium CG12_big_fil_rev_8_21_14_0_65_38_15]PIR29884.1 MAG: hypothetical protein COV38_08025 [Bdellovibrionales bacterium CG11_big_fil_rev_8_21_14_0_20_38_13]